jgi:hypothetical protein
MKSKSNRLLQITTIATIAIIAFALYSSIISEGFQTIPKSKTVIELFNSIKSPAWYTTE